MHFYYMKRTQKHEENLHPKMLIFHYKYIFIVIKLNVTPKIGCTYGPKFPLILCNIILKKKHAIQYVPKNEILMDLYNNLTCS